MKQTGNSKHIKHRTHGKMPASLARNTQIQHAIQNGTNVDAEECFLPLLLLMGLWGGSRSLRRRGGVGFGGSGGGGGGFGGRGWEGIFGGPTGFWGRDSGLGGPGMMGKFAGRGIFARRGIMDGFGAPGAGLGAPGAGFGGRGGVFGGPGKMGGDAGMYGMPGQMFGSNRGPGGYGGGMYPGMGSGFPGGMWGGRGGGWPTMF